MIDTQLSLEITDEDQEGISRYISGAEPFEKPATNNVLNCLSSKSTEWYTPAKYVEAARKVMGGIDIDPASNDVANLTVKATTYYTKETNGFNKPWHGRVWLNPPYGYDSKKCNQSRWSQRLIEQYQAGITTQAVLLVSANIDTGWCQPLFDYPTCLVKGRINFYGPNDAKSGATHGSILVYFGDNVEKFVQVFSQFGKVVRAYPSPTASLWEGVA